MPDFYAMFYDDSTSVLSFDGREFECVWPNHHALLTVGDDGSISGKYSMGNGPCNIVMAPSYAEATAFAFELVPYMRNEHSQIMFLSVFGGEKMKRKGWEVHNADEACWQN